MTDETMIAQLTKIGDERIRIENDLESRMWQETRKEARDAHGHT